MTDPTEADVLVKAKQLAHDDRSHGLKAMRAPARAAARSSAPRDGRSGAQPRICRQTRTRHALRWLFERWGNAESAAR